MHAVKLSTAKNDLLVKNFVTKFYIHSISYDLQNHSYNNLLFSRFDVIFLLSQKVLLIIKKTPNDNIFS